MDEESKATTTEAALAAAAEAAPGTASTTPAAALHRLDEVVRQVKAELISGHERRRGSNPYDSELGRPTRDVWGSRKRT